MTIRFIDLFAGVGGFHYGLDTASREKNGRGKTSAPENVGPGQGLESAPGQGDRGSSRWPDGNAANGVENRSFTCVYSNEWDKYANSVYRRHYGNCDQTDIRKVNASDIPEFDLLAGGFPCQSFSVAGRRGGFDDTRGTLFFEIARIAAERQPRLLLLENVKGLLSHDQGRTFGTILATLDGLGYDLQWQVLNSKNFGVPQNRERVYIVGHLRGTPRPEVFPLTGPDCQDQNLELRHEAKQLISPTLRTPSGGHHLPTIAKDTLIRRLTPIECERLQGFPDNWTRIGADGEAMSDTQRYKMMGNAVTTKVVAEIARRFIA